MRKLIYLLFVLSILMSCIHEPQYTNTPKGNFEALWKLLDERYCFFNYKQIDWDSVHEAFAPRISDSMNEEQLFSVMSEMLNVLKDGHVNLYSSFDISRYWKWFTLYPTNFDDSIQSLYLGDNYRIASGIKYKILDDNIGYMYYGDFSVTVGEGNMDQIISRFNLCDGIIIDVRNNGGGMLTNVDIIASRFTNERVLTGYISHKTGKGHDDFSKPYPKYLETTGRLRYQKPVIVLTNRQCYSAANDFISVMKQLPNVTIMGDRTGGGSGLPFSSELPNGWSIRFSACPMYDADMNQTEFGIDPDTLVRMTRHDKDLNLDTFIETARKMIKEKSKVSL